MKPKPLLNLSLGAFAVMLLTTLPVQAAKKVKYVPPEGYAGHLWGELRTSFTRLPSEPIGIGAAWMNPVEKESSFTCILKLPTDPTQGGGVEGCDFQATLARIQKKSEGGGFYVLSEFTIEEQGFRYGGENDGVIVHPVVYQFCANWDDTKRVVPRQFDEINKFCGVRLMFQSDTREQLRGKPPEYVTNYDRMLAKLLERFGKPDNFVSRGQVLIETPEGESTDQADRKFSIYRWCPARDKGLHTDCTASVVLSMNPATGVGAVLYSTPLLWEFAFARERNQKGDRLFKMLHARK